MRISDWRSDVGSSDLTVARAVRNLSERGADFCTIHGNQSIMEAAAKAKSGNTKVLAVTALTSLDQGDLEDLGFQCDIADLVLSRARRSLAVGCDGGEIGRAHV